MHEDPFDDLLREAAEEYHQPPEIPRHEMWQRLQDTRAARQQPRPRRRTFYPLIWAAGIAAGVILGVGIGRFSTVNRLPPPRAVSDVISSDMPETSLPDVAEGSGPAHALRDPPLDTGNVKPVSTAKRAKHARSPRRSAVDQQTASATYRITMIEHLGQAEVFLTLFRLSAQHGTTNPFTSPTARQLLATNRLLLDSPAGADKPARALLQDLELVLARIAQLSPASKADDLKRITKELERAGLMTRVRNEVPAGMRPMVGRGAI